MFDHEGKGVIRAADKKKREGGERRGLTRRVKGSPEGTRSKMVAVCG